MDDKGLSPRLHKLTKHINKKNPIKNEMNIRNLNQKEKVKLFQFPNDIILYVNNPKDCTDNMTELIN